MKETLRRAFLNSIFMLLFYFIYFPTDINLFILLIHFTPFINDSNEIKMNELNTNTITSLH